MAAATPAPHATFSVTFPGHGTYDESAHARLVADPNIERGGCLVESDLGTVDARVATRWARAMAALGPLSLADPSGDGAHS